MAFVLKIKYGESLRRLTVPKAANGGPDLAFHQLEARIREYFQIPEASKLVVTYTDKDGDVVTMAQDQELHDACVIQGLNPLRISVSVGVEGQKKKSPVREIPEAIEAALSSLNLKSLLNDKPEKVIAEAMQFFNKVQKDSMKSEAGASFVELLQGFASGAGTSKPEAEASKASEGPAPPKCPAMDASPPVHHNVQCDGCGASPIVGPRFKSISKDDYDLCQNCFQEQPKGSEADYARHDRPILRHLPLPAFGIGSGRPLRCPAGPRGFFRPPHFRDMRGSDRHDHAWLKPDGRFVCDATIPDGTEIAPGTQFVKIWRLRNSGKVTWGPGTQLVRVGGDELGSVSAVTLQLPEGGVQPDQEIEVAVDLVAPAKAGRYVSYWRLMTPFNVKFGHRVWALIQVVPTSSSKPSDDFETVEVERSPESAVEEDHPVIVERPVAEDVVGGYPPVEAPVVVTESDVPVVTPSSPSSSTASASVEADKKISDTASEVEGFSMVSMPEQDTPVEEMLAKLESMGFNHRKLNQELLEKNDFDVQRTLDDLCSAAEWDPILEELEEMGFYDSEMNRRLMFKNKGSFKHVVKELVQMYKEAPQPEA